MSVAWNDMLAMAPQLILLCGALGILVSQLVLKSGRVRVAWQLAVLSLVLAMLVSFVGLSDVKGVATLLPRAFWGFETVGAINNTYRYSVFSANAIFLFLTLALCVVLYMRQIMPELELNFAENYFLVLMSTLGYSYAVCAEDLMTLFVALELGALPTLILIGINRKDRSTNEASIKYLLLSTFAVAFLLLGIALIYGSTGTLKLHDLHEIGPHFLKTRVMTVAYLFIFVGFLFKFTAFPLHSYAADVYEGSTTIFTGLLASLSKVAGVLILFKIAMGMHDGFRPYLAPALSFAAIGSMLFGSLASLGTRSLKRILAYSAVDHAGLMLCFFVVPSSIDGSTVGAIKQDAGSALFIYAVAYSFASLLAFATIAFLEQRTAEHAPVTLQSLSGLYQRDKIAAWALGLAILSLMGMPPLAGFFAKFYLFKYLALSGNLALAAAAGIASAISLYAYVRILLPIFFSEPENITAPAGGRGIHVRDAARTAMAVSLAIVLGFAFIAAFLYRTGVTAVQRIN